MVIGLERFKAHFAGLEDSYILIGGSACDVNLNALGGAFRMTKDRSSRTGADTPQVVPRADQFQKTGEFPRLFGKSSQFLFQDWQDQRLDATVRFSKGGHVRLLVLVDKS